MATTVPKSASLPLVRRLEAVSFRSWPAAKTVYDGTWALRLTAGHPAKRLNSLNPLDPGDNRDIGSRLARAERLFESYDRPLILRASPLCPPELNEILDNRGWRTFDKTIVMTANLDGETEAVERVPLQDVGRWIDACVTMGEVDKAVKPGLRELISAVEGEVGLFLDEADDGAPRAAAMAVRFGDLLGLFEIVTHPDARRAGHGRSIVASAMQWGRSHGARQAWLQVVAENEAACALYASMGFAPVYSYVYRQAASQIV
ncbi:MAG: GNAT family N-acetyltransferase [Pseudomonadota bacterium]